MDDLISKLQSILSTKEGQEQLKNIQNMLSNSNNTQPQGNSNSNGGFDMSSLAGILSSMNNSSPPPEPAPNNDTNGKSNIDMSALMSMLSGLNSNSQGNSESNSSNDMPNIDIDMILKLQKVLSNMNTNDKNSQLLLALKPHFSEERSKRVDKAISIMRLLSVMPLLKESGLFSGL